MLLFSHKEVSWVKSGIRGRFKASLFVKSEEEITKSLHLQSKQSSPIFTSERTLKSLLWKTGKILKWCFQVLLKTILIITKLSNVLNLPVMMQQKGKIASIFMFSECNPGLKSPL